MTHFTQQQMAERDARQFELMTQAARAQAQFEAVGNQRRRLAGDRQRYVHRVLSWTMTREEVEKKLAELHQSGDTRVNELVSREGKAAHELAILDRQVAELEAVWCHELWPRYYPCLNSDGHIHSSLRGCESVWATTQMGWDTSLSGKTVEEAIAKLGPRLCSKCYPDAPSDWCRSLADITREEREAAKKAREEAKFIKRLRPEETFRASDGDRIETVAACKTLLREAVRAVFDEMWWTSDAAAAWYQGDAASLANIRRSKTERVAAWQQDSGNAAQVLLAREETRSGTGATQREIDEIIASATRREAKALQERGKQ